MAIRKILNFITYCCYAVFAAGVLAVLVASFQWTIQFLQYQENDRFVYLPENLFILLPCMSAVLQLLFWYIRREEEWTDEIPGPAGAARTKTGGRNHTSGFAVEAAVLIFAAVYGLFVIFSIRGLATNDGLMLDREMNNFLAGDYSGLSGGYFRFYPFQLGYTAVGTLIGRIFGPSNYIVFQILNVIAILMTMWSLYQITREISGSERTAGVMAILSFGAWFYYAFSTFVYNDIWSIGLQTVSLYFCVKYLKEDSGKKYCYAAGTILFIAIAYLLKTNCLIAIIAMTMAVLFLALRECVDHKAKTAAARIVVIALMWICSFGLSKGVENYYLKAADLDAMPQGVPTAAYLAMGMMEGEDGKAGWYNGFNARVLSENDFDHDLAVQESVEAIKERWADFMSSKRRMLRFYRDKFLSQWGDGTCVSLREQEETARHVENQPAAAQWIVFGGGYQLAGWVMNVYHSLLYLGAALYCVFALLRVIRSRRANGDGKEPLPEFETMLVIFIFGGMAFHMLWEASSRYVIRYYLTMLPLAAMGYSQLFMRRKENAVGDHSRV